MRKDEAIQLLGGSVARAAESIGVSYQAVNKWPEVLTPRIEDRVYAALWRMQRRKVVKAPPPRVAELS